MGIEKQLLLSEMKSQIGTFPSFVLIQHAGLDSVTLGGFRDKIAECGGDVEFVKKRIFVRAAKESQIDFSLDELPGQIGVVFSGDDAVQTTKMLFELKKETGSAVSVLVGHFEGKKISAEDVKTLSELPSKEVMQSQLLAAFEAPLSQTLATFEAVLSAVPSCLERKVEKESSGVG